MQDKFILDACCGGRMMWFEKNHPNTTYVDNRIMLKGLVNGKPSFEIKPDIIADFRELPFKDNSFKLIVFDPPHFIGKKISGRMMEQFGFLNKDTWKEDLTKGFREMWRCLEDYGVLIFKFSDYHIPFNKVLDLFPIKPLFGNIKSVTKNNTTKWFCFMKIPECVKEDLGVKQ